MTTSKLTEQIMRRRLAATARVLMGLRGPSAASAALRAMSQAALRARTVPSYRRVLRGKTSN